MNRDKTVNYPQPPASTGSQPQAGRMAGSRESSSQAAYGRKARDMKRGVARKNGANPADCDGDND